MAVHAEIEINVVRRHPVNLNVIWQEMHEAIAQLKQNGWTVTTSRANSFRLPAAIARRYGETPSVMAEVLAGITGCVSPDQKSWLLCQRDFAANTAAAFTWNQWELMSLESADGDEKLITDIKTFWDAHLPIYISVRDGYSYAAIRTKKPKVGTVVQGREPEFEEASLVASSFLKFLRKL